jgi:hypothetical protein
VRLLRALGILAIAAIGLTAAYEAGLEHGIAEYRLGWAHCIDQAERLFVEGRR